MRGHGFTSAFAAELEAYLGFKQAMGSPGRSRKWYLGQFDAYCTANGLGVFDKATVEGWVTAQLDRSGRYRSWMSYIRDFGRWLRSNGAEGAYVLSEHWKAPVVPAHPYLLSRQEVGSFFEAAGALEVPSPWRWQAAAFFTLMHSTFPCIAVSHWPDCLGPEAARPWPVPETVRAQRPYDGNDKSWEGSVARAPTVPGVRRGRGSPLAAGGNGEVHAYSCRTPSRATASSNAWRLPPPIALTPPVG